MKNPNLFIVGAPKSGTTFLYHSWKTDFASLAASNVGGMHLYRTKEVFAVFDPDGQILEF